MALLPCDAAGVPGFVKIEVADVRRWKVTHFFATLQAYQTS